MGRRWYSARLLYECVLYESPDGPELPPDEDHIFEDKLIVFRAEEDDDTEDIVNKVLTLAKKEEVEYEAAAGNWVKWVFREILEIQEIMSRTIKDGTEVYFRRWHDPTDKDFEVMRETHEEPWWPQGRIEEPS